MLRWAAKEACIKAVQPRRVTLRQVEIWTLGKSQAPIAVILDSASDHPVQTPEQEMQVGNEEKAEEQGNGQDDEAGGMTKPSEVKVLRKVQRKAVPWVKLQDLEGQVVKISISHDVGYSTAVAIAPEMLELESVAADIGTPASDV